MRHAAHLQTCAWERGVEIMMGTRFQNARPVSLKASSRLSESDSEQEVKEVSEFTYSSPAMRARFAFSSSSDSELEDSELKIRSKDMRQKVQFK
ncbi:hypothetical protein Taro_002658 [Colocasia esculenta]|uniref:Uncharacterized protein n=1 Tax=Colocasia esculenta TaxID=4460 RepID=A0A843TLJ1_COLES|nr:hypothetical protein [Colocasia esculenta]